MNIEENTGILRWYLPQLIRKGEVVFALRQSHLNHAKSAKRKHDLDLQEYHDNEQCDTERYLNCSSITNLDVIPDLFYF